MDERMSKAELRRAKLGVICALLVIAGTAVLSALLR